MKKRLTTNTLAFANIKNRRRQYLIMVISIILAMVLSSGVVFFLFSSSETLLAANRNKYGNQTHIVYTDENSESVYEKAVKDGVLSEYGLAHLIGFGYTDPLEEDMGTAIAWLDSSAKEISNQTFIDGAYPENAGEIAVEESTLLKLGLENAQIGDEITLSVKVQNNSAYLETCEQTYTLTGIVADKKSYIQKFNGSSNYYNNMIPAAFVAEGTQTEIGGLERLVAYVTESNYTIYNSRLWEYLMQNTDGFECSTTNAQSSFYLASAFSAISSGGEYIILVTLVLIFTSALAIINAFNTNLKERKSQIGMLRAVGATRRQIINIFGREAFFISLVCTPVSIAVSYVLVRILIGILSGSAVMTKSVWVLPVSAVICIIVTMAAALVPLFAASRITPIQAIRNIDRNRKMNVKKIKSKKEFNAPRHLAKRSITFYRGAKAAVSIMLSVIILFSCFGFSYYFAVKDSLLSFEADYTIDVSSYYHDFYNLTFNGISESDKAEICSYPYFSDVTSNKSICAQLHVDALTDYLNCVGEESFFIYETPDLDSLTYENYAEKCYSEYDESYLQALDTFGYTDYFLPLGLYSLNNEAVEKLKGSLTDGDINISALSSGDEIILIAPQKAEIAVSFTDYGISSYHIADDVRKLEKNYQTVLSGECPYSVGDKITLSVINYDSEDDAVLYNDNYTRVDREVTIGAIISPAALSENETVCIYDGFAILTTNSGMNSFCETAKYNRLSINVSENIDIDADVEETVLDFLQPIATKYGGNIDSNYAYNQDQKEDYTRLFVALIAIAIIGFAIAGSIINNSLTASIRESKRQIGTLRAVGASEKELVLSYIRRLLSMFATGCIIGFGGFTVSYIAIWAVCKAKGSNFSFLFSPWAAFGMCAVLFAVCAVNLWSKIRKEMKNSIVDNIREL